MLRNAIDLSGISNARELGGYRIGERQVKKGVLIRTAKLNHAAPKALQILEKEYHVRKVIDFRMLPERMRTPDPAIPGAENIGLSVIEMEDYPAPDKTLEGKYQELKHDRMAMFELLYDSGLLGPQTYDMFLFGERGIKAYRTFFRILLEHDPLEGAVLWHCTDGKDRTGCAAMLLLTALGADRKTVMEDYLLTNDFHAEMFSFVNQQAEEKNLVQEKRNALIFISGGVCESYMLHLFHNLQERYGGTEGYLRDVLGIGREETGYLREKYLSRE